MLGNVQVDKTVFMPKNKNAVAVIYKITNKTVQTLKLDFIRF